jgi:phosphatidate cytidylyltransferase
MAVPSSRAGDLFPRALSGFAVVLIVSAALYLGAWWWAGVASCIALVSLWEFYGMLEREFHVSRGIGILVGIVTLVFTGLSSPLEYSVVILPAAVLFVLTIEVLRRQLVGTSNAIRNAGGTLAGVLYIVYPWSFLIEMRTREWGLLLTGALLLCTWSCDVMAYLVGNRWGRLLLCEKVSPKKTWEGALGGLCGSLFTAGLLAYISGVPPLPLLFIGLLCGLVGQLGDLAESVLKRETGVKDSGSIIPGHGGMLDRFDSVLFSASCVYMLFEVIWN